MTTFPAGAAAAPSPLVPPATPETRADIRTIGVVGTAHFGSHVMQLALAPVLPLIVADFNVTFAAMGLVIACFYATSGMGQVISGLLADRIGPHRLLFAGMLIQVAGVVAMTLAPSYFWLFPASIVAGIGNSVYHPADMSILNRRVSAKWIGRAVATHVVAGSIGFALSPLMVGLVGAEWGWRAGAACSAIVGLGVTIFVIANKRWLVTEHVVHAVGTKLVSFRDILTTRPLVMAFIFFIVASVAGNAIMNFTSSALHEGYEASLTLATIIVTLSLTGSALGTLIAGILVDRGVSHHRIGFIGVLGATVLYLVASVSALPIAVVAAALFLAGVLFGATLPARDLLVRESAPRGSLGRSFGLVYSGADIGQLIGPLLLGPLLDHGYPEMVLVVAGVFTIAGLPTMLLALRRAPIAKTVPAE